jgi:hypothetical protein
MKPSLTSGNLRELLAIEARMRAPRLPVLISEQESATLVSIAAGTRAEFSFDVIKKLLSTGMLYDDRGGAGLFLTDRARETLRAHPPAI